MPHDLCWPGIPFLPSSRTNTTGFDPKRLETSYHDHVQNGMKFLSKNISSSGTLQRHGDSWEKKRTDSQQTNKKLDQIKGFLEPANLGQMSIALYPIFCNPFTAKWHHPNGILPNVSLDAFQCRSFSRGLHTVVGAGPLPFEMQKNWRFWSFINLHQIFRKLC